jgi:hypothetical protein
MSRRRKKRRTRRIRTRRSKERGPDSEREEEEEGEAETSRRSYLGCTRRKAAAFPLLFASFDRENVVRLSRCSYMTYEHVRKRQNLAELVL